MKQLLMTAAFLGATTFGAQAGTINLVSTDFTFVNGVLQGGNCPSNASPCLQIAGNNGPDGITMTYSGGVFTLTSLAYTMQGKSGIDFTGSDAMGVSGMFSDSQTGGNSGTLSADLATASANLTGDFVDITSLLIQNIGTGAIRIGGFTGTAPMPSAVPLPAAGMLLLTALGGFAAFGRRKA